jgi:ABC-2 type transport system permease protein
MSPAALYVRLIGARVRSQLQYRASFALEFAGMFLVSFLDFAAVLIIFHNVPQLAGWSVGQVAFLYAASSVSFAFADMVIGHLDAFPQLIRDGSFDLLLIRPRGTLFQVATLDFQLRRLGRAAQGLAVLVYALAALHVHWSAGRVAMLVAMLVSGTVIFGAVWVATICLVFWAVEGREAVSAFTDGGAFFAQYPIDIYGAWLRRFLAYLVPMAFVCYFPSLYILGKEDPLGAPEWLSFASPGVALIAAVGAGMAWRLAVRHYRSAGG